MKWLTNSPWEHFLPSTTLQSFKERSSLVCSLENTFHKRKGWGGDLKSCTHYISIVTSIRKTSYLLEHENLTMIIDIFRCRAVVVVGETMLSLWAFRHSSSEVNGVFRGPNPIASWSVARGRQWFCFHFFPLQEQIPRLIGCIRLNESQTMQTWCMQIYMINLFQCFLQFRIMSEVAKLQFPNVPALSGILGFIINNFYNVSWCCI